MGGLPDQYSPQENTTLTALEGGLFRHTAQTGSVTLAGPCTAASAIRFRARRVSGLCCADIWVRAEVISERTMQGVSSARCAECANTQPCGMQAN